MGARIHQRLFIELIYRILIYLPHSKNETLAEENEFRKYR